MKEENIDALIEKAVKSISAKKKQINEWELDESRWQLQNRKKRFYRVGVAASVAIIGAVGLSYYGSIHNGSQYDVMQSSSYDSQYSSLSIETLTGDEEIKALIKMKEYETALEVINQAMKDTETDLIVSDTDNAKELIKKRIYTLSWIKIQALIGLDRKSEAIILLKEYAEKEGAYQEEAQNILKDLNNTNHK